ncbi:TauE/SafE family permease protein (plasmid) [Rhizobium phaseoli]|uniref:sulfite exporter TauE/SafE family protein n=1 Tax=Rhizobium phaseoli TaxID=396 RepID=UPI0007F14090|nr:sulfite exporter TauE/SafE family protein [Rhizobium phaseoli]ANL51003.1 TauE/SafE family permease protein [Rhizobium phaseoli]
MTGEINFLGGMVMGLSSSLHCAGICGGIASTLLFVTGGIGAGKFQRMTILASMQFGRIFTYTTFGATIGLVGSGLESILALAGLQPFLRLTAALALAWAGLSIAGVTPSFARLDRLFSATSGRSRGKLSRLPAFFLGMVWGLAPCGMVLAALLNAMLAGSPTGGGTFMLGFGLATIPPVAATAFGVRIMAGNNFVRRQSRSIRVGLGIALVLLAALSTMTDAVNGALCLPS